MSSANLKAAATGQVAPSPLAKFSNFMDKLKPQLALALPKHMNADRMARLAVTAFSTNPDLQKCSQQSIAGSIMTAAQMGLEPGINGQGYLIPYKQVCTFVPGWKGLADLVSRSGRATVWTGVVMPGDKFEYQLGDSPFCRHIPGDGEGDVFTHVYAIGRVRDASMAVIEVWTRAKVQKHLKKYNRVGDRHYAKADENNFEMYARKVALLQVLKYMPASIELQNAIEVSNAVDDGKNAVLEGDFVTVSDVSDAPEVDPPPPPAAPADAGKPPAPPAPPPEKEAAASKPPRRSYAAFVAIINAHGPDGDAKAVAADMEAARAELPPEHWDELCNYHERVFGSRPQGAK